MIKIAVAEATKVAVTGAAKELMYFAAGSANAAALAERTQAAQNAQTTRYSLTFAKEFEILTLDDQLKTHPGAATNDLTLVTKEGARITFDDVKIDVKKENTIVATPLVHRDGTVKEYIQSKDYAISIAGTIRTNQSGKFPFEELKTLNNILKTKELIAVANKYINDIFEVYQVVFKNADFRQSSMKGMNVMPFQINFESDADYDFLLI